MKIGGSQDNLMQVKWARVSLKGRNRSLYIKSLDLVSQVMSLSKGQIKIKREEEGEKQSASLKYILKVVIVALPYSNLNNNKRNPIMS